MFWFSSIITIIIITIIIIIMRYLKLQVKVSLISRGGKIPYYKDVLITAPQSVLGTICALCVVLSVALDFLHVGRGTRIESQEQLFFL
jgi:uncharacterized membrane protein YidH (DUF202 family)